MDNSMPSDCNEDSHRLHRKAREKIQLGSKILLRNGSDLSRAYMPEVACVCEARFTKIPPDKR